MKNFKACTNKVMKAKLFLRHAGRAHKVKKALLDKTLAITEAAHVAKVEDFLSKQAFIAPGQDELQVSRE